MTFLTLSLTFFRVTLRKFHIAKIRNQYFGKSSKIVDPRASVPWELDFKNIKKRIADKKKSKHIFNGNMPMTLKMSVKN